MSHYTEVTMPPGNQQQQRTILKQALAASPNTLKAFGNTKYITLFRQITRSEISPPLFWRTYAGSSSYKRRRDNSRHAASLQIFNAELCSFYRLPVELILQIIQLLPALDKFCLRMTSRRFASIIKRTDVQTKQDYYTKAGVEGRLARDKFTKLADTEVVTTQSPSHLLCWPCRTSHPRRYFDDTEIFQSGRVRRCRGHMCLLEICPHLWLNREDVLARIQQVTRVTIDCPIILGNGGCVTKPSMLLESKIFEFGSPHFVNRIMLGQSLLYKNLGPISTLDRSAVQDMLQGLAARICPHMSTHHDELLQRISEISGGRIFGILRSEEGAQTDNRMSVQIPCLAEACDTQLEIERLAYNDQTNLHFTVSRNLGRMEDPLDPKWLVQCGVSNT
ncbi:hypothetical protein DE146DRAFT_297800 [Phaeosphaeria sp. MPI-PUGE-AT-0046c]|nr:hypothetical protein DE146DRAFT_297800 [Phaeosphaeria sp. MPI-PUGE-AT-0046c]